MTKLMNEGNLPLSIHNNSNYKIIDLFAGIGGIRSGFERVFKSKCKIAFSSEIDKNAQKTYFVNYNDMPYGDISQIDEKTVPSHDVILARFSCQAFSIAGYRKGFDDTRGTLFFDVARITKHHKPQILFLENVKGFVNHDKGNTFKVVKETLETLGYKVYAEVLNTKDYGVLQNRERIYIVAFLDHSVEFKFPEDLALSYRYKQAGNSVTVEVIEKIAQEIKKAIERKLEYS